MAYVGNIPAEAYISLSSQTFTTINGTGYTLSSEVTNSEDIALFLNDVRQQPSTYTATGTTLTMGTATTTADAMYCVYLGKGIQTVNPPAASVNTAEIADGAVTNAKVDASAAVAYSKLNLTDSIVNADINSSAAIATSKITGLAASATTDTTDASNIASGTLPDGRFPATLPTASGANLTNLNATNLATGTVGTNRLASTGTASSSTFLRGDQAWAEAGGGSLVKLLSTTISTGVAEVAFNSTYINSTYDNYRIIVYGLSTAADNQDVALRMSVDNGVSFATHVGCFNWTQINGGSVAQNTVGSRASIPLGSDEEGDDSGATNFIIDLMNLNSTTQYKYANGLGVTNNQTNTDYYGYRVHGYIASNTAVNYVKIFTETGGNLDAGTVTLYGYEK